MKSTSKIRGVCTSLIGILVLVTAALFSALNMEAPSDDLLALTFGTVVVIMTITYTVASHWGKVSIPTFITLFIGHFVAFAAFEIIMSLYGYGHSHGGLVMIYEGAVCLLIAGLSCLFRCYDAKKDEEEERFFKNLKEIAKIIDSISNDE